ncbi:MAG: sulfatase-like hydrolase/transferase [Oligosphaeraceae bacterium]|nr:sulfatase-like hydrolase/transferase [Oligosphaeraceae bacterium]
MSKPNILFLCADQMRGDALHCAGNTCIHTPHLDRLAARGARFPNAFSVDPVCVPARASMITGNYPHRCTGVKANGGTVKPGQVVMPEYFRSHGYRTYAAGKLHFLPYAGPGTPRTTHGYEQVSLAESGRIISRYDPSGRTPGLEDYHDYLNSVGWGGYSRAHGIGNNDIHPAASPLPQEHCVDAYVASRAIDYLNEHQQQHPEEPFLLFASFPKPHAPYDPPLPFASLYDPRSIPAPLEKTDSLPHAPGKFIEQITHGWSKFSPEMHRVAKAYYYALVTFQDLQIGRIITALSELGQLDNTIILYTADHGDMTGDFGFWGKGCFYRGSVNVPLLISAPGITANGTVLDDLAGTHDLFPTLAALAGLPLSHKVDGSDLSARLNGSCRKQIRPYAISYYNSSPQQGYMVANQDIKYIYNECNCIEELYDLKRDPGEQNNLIADPEYQPAYQNLRGILQQWAVDNEDLEILDHDGGLRVSTLDIPGEHTFMASSMGWRHY